jgi:hypothetical protein
MRPGRWHGYNTAAGRPGSYHDLGNRVFVSPDRGLGGSAALGAFAVPPPDRPGADSKASAWRSLFRYAKGDEIRFSLWTYVEPARVDALGTVALIDFEATWQFHDGLRLLLREDRSLAFEMEFPKLLFAGAAPGAEPFPLEQWVLIKGQLDLSEELGRIQVWQDGSKALDVTGRTLPFHDTVYDRVEIGATAYWGGTRPTTVYFDDLAIAGRSVIPIPAALPLLASGLLLLAGLRRLTRGRRRRDPDGSLGRDPAGALF